MNYETLSRLLSNHRLWLEDHLTGERLSLAGMTLTDKSFSYSDLRKADFRRANLSGASMYRADLKEQKVYSRELHKYVVPVCDIDKAQAVEQDWRFYYNHGYKQAERDLKRPKGEWDETSSEQEESEQPKEETFNTVYDHNDGIADPTYINDMVDCSDLGIYPWGNS